MHKDRFSAKRLSRPEIFELASRKLLRSPPAFVLFPTLLPLPELEQHHCQAEMCLEVIRVRLEGTSEVRHRCLQTVDPHENKAKDMVDFLGIGKAFADST